MGWMYTSNLAYAPTRINETLRMLKASEVAPATDLGDWIIRRVAGAELDPYALFYIAPSSLPDSEGTDYIGVMLLDIRVEESLEAKRLESKAVLWVPESDGPIPVGHQMVQIWGYECMAASEGIRHYNCPVDWFNRVSAHGPLEETWRAEVLKCQTN